MNLDFSITQYIGNASYETEIRRMNQSYLHRTYRLTALSISPTKQIARRYFLVELRSLDLSCFVLLYSFVINKFGVCRRGRRQKKWMFWTCQVYYVIKSIVVNLGFTFCFTTILSGIVNSQCYSTSQTVKVVFNVGRTLTRIFGILRFI